MQLQSAVLVPSSSVKVGKTPSRCLYRLMTLAWAKACSQEDLAYSVATHVEASTAAFHSAESDHPFVRAADIAPKRK